eukprot:Pgem_evm1s9856
MPARKMSLPSIFNKKNHIKPEKGSDNNKNNNIDDKNNMGSNNNNNDNNNNNNNNANDKVEKSEKEWKNQLSSQEYRVIREKGTEMAGTGEYNKFQPKEGYFACKACKNPLYSYQSKFNASCGWPAFDK